MEDGDHSRHTVDPFEAEAQINQHPGERIGGREQSLPAQLSSDLRSDDLDIAHAEIRQEKSILQGSYHGGVDRSL
jgi:hypothetical protein